MMIARTMNAKDLKLTPPPQMAAEQRKAWDVLCRKPSNNPRHRLVS